MDDSVQVLHKAVENSDEQLIKTLIQNGVNLKATNDRGMNCLHLAVEKSSSEIVDQLLKADKSLVNEVVVYSERESNDIVGYTALHFSAKLKDVKIAFLLFWNGAKVDMVDKNLRTPLHVAALYGNTLSMEVLLYYRASVNAEDFQGKTAFMYAVECDHVNIVKLMLSKADEEICKSYAKAIVEISSDSRCVEFVQLLLFDIKCQMLYDEMLIEVLKYAIKKNRIYAIGKLLSGINISVSFDESLENPRPIATVGIVKRTNIKVAQFLMNCNYIIKFVDLETALHIAVVNRCNDILNTYLKEGVNVDCKDAIGNSLLFMTCLENNLDAAKKCIALGCDVHVKNSSGDTALHAAVKTVNPELVYLLKESGCILNAKNNNLETSFELFLENLFYFHDVNRNLSSDLIEFKQNNVMAVARMFLKDGIDLNCHENGNECVLHLAVMTGIVELVKLVIEYHPSLDHLDERSGQTCLHVAVELNYAVVKVLLELGANPDLNDRLGRLPITIAIDMGHEEIVTLLVNNSNLNAYRDSTNKKTVMHLAARSNNKEIIRTVIYAGVDLHAKDVFQRTAMCFASEKKYEYVIGESVCQQLLNVGFDVNVGCHEYLETCMCWSEFYTQEFAKIHVLKLHLLEYDLQPFLLSLIHNAVMEFQDVYFDIREEANRLSISFIPNTEIRFTNIIRLNDKKLANYAENESVVKVFKDVDFLKMKWPHYWQILIGRMTKGFVRRRLLDKCYVIFKSVAPKLLDECVELIFDNLETSELHTFIVSFPFVDTSEYDDLWFIH